MIGGHRLAHAFGGACAASGCFKFHGPLHLAAAVGTPSLDCIRATDDVASAQPVGMATLCYNHLRRSVAVLKTVRCMRSMSGSSVFGGVQIAGYEAITKSGIMNLAEFIIHIESFTRISMSV